MDVINEVLPTDPDRITEMMAEGPEGPIFMVNLLKFKERAEYADGRETDLSGREAYGLYGQAVSQIIRQYDGEVIFVGDVTFLSLGQVEELWDEVAIAKYPNRAALWAMSTSPEWNEAAVHRAAGLAGQLNIETVSNPFGRAICRSASARRTISAGSIRMPSGPPLPRSPTLASIMSSRRIMSVSSTAAGSTVRSGSLRWAHWSLAWVSTWA